ncbi:hypothetical protein HID58_075997 [Brassica napus]|uniref:Transmembrane protein n=1 Tax=Brassica napus TaxID=3708 RepID=A0ABQ7YL86_BRANA|nr:hypothetical protein HID58_075997 [Brassica napus]
MEYRIRASVYQSERCSPYKGLHLLGLGQTLVVFDVVFLVVGLSLIIHMTAPRFADFVLSPLPSLFSHLVVAFIAVCVSDGSLFRHVWIVFCTVYTLCAWKVVSGLKLELWFLGGWLLFSLPHVVSLLPLLPLVLYSKVSGSRSSPSLKWITIMFSHQISFALMMSFSFSIKHTFRFKNQGEKESGDVITVISMPSQNVPVAGDAMFMDYIANRDESDGFNYT